MSGLIWVLTGAIAAWMACSVLDLNLGRGLTVFGIIAAVGALFGGEALEPMLRGAGDEVGVRGSALVLVASVCGIACLKITRIVCRTHQNAPVEEGIQAFDGQPSARAATQRAR
jgi:hypothetical protein